MPRITNAEQTEAIATLRAALQPGDTVHLIMRHVSRSGMRRVFDTYVIRDGEMLRYSWSVAQALGWTYNRKREGVQVDGCGMDMGFHLVYTLGRVLWPSASNEPGQVDPGYSLNYRHV